MTTVVPSIPALLPGLRHSESMIVTSAHTVPEVAAWPGFKDMPAVFATAMMIGFMEQTCIQALRPYLQAGQCTVGTHVDMSHVAATPVGMAVRAEVELLEVNARSLRFKVRCTDDVGLIGEGVHQRAIVDKARFEERLQAKASQP